MKIIKLFPILLAYFLIVSTTILLSDCKSTPKLSSSKNAKPLVSKRSVSKSRNPARYAIRASAVGGVAGAVIEKYMDKQAAQLRQDLVGISQVERVGQGIEVTLNNALFFKPNSYELSTDWQPQLKKLAETLLIYRDTEMLIAGHTDNVGNAEENRLLSQKRAESLADFLQAHQVSMIRIVTQGFGQDTPKILGDTEDARRQNQRLELVIVANSALKKQAKSGKSVE